MNKKQLFINIFANIFAFIVSTGINFFLTPYILDTVGVKAYGFVPLASNFTSYITILTSAFDSMSGRFVTIKIHENNKEEAKKYFTTSFYMGVGLSIFSSVIFILLVCFLQFLINIPVDLIYDIKLLFALTFVATSVSLLTSVFGIAVLCKNRLDYKSYVSIGSTFLRGIILLGLFYFFTPKIYYIGLATLVIVIYESIANFKITNRLLPELKIKKKYFEKKLIRVLLSSGIWNSFNRLSSVLMTGLDLLVTNIFIGTTESGIMGIVKVIPGLIYTIISLMITSFTPQFIQDFAHKDFDNLIKNIKFSAKLIGFISIIPLSGFIAYGEEFYSLWVPSQNAKLLISLSILTMLGAIVSYPTSAFDNVFTATNKLKWPAIATFICGILNVIIVIILLNTTSLGLYAIAGTSSILSILRDLFFKIPYVAKNVNTNPITFWKIIFRFFCTFVIITIISIGIKHIIPITSWLLLIVDAIFTVIISLFLNYLILFNKEERKQVKKVLLNIKKFRLHIRG